MFGLFAAGVQPEPPGTSLVGGGGFLRHDPTVV
jgi:hypothetical protein